MGECRGWLGSRLGISTPKGETESPGDGVREKSEQILFLSPNVFSIIPAHSRPQERTVTDNTECSFSDVHVVTSVPGLKEMPWKIETRSWANEAI